MIQKHKPRRIVLAWVIILAGALLTSCNPGPQEPDKPRIAFVLKTLNNPFFIDMEKGAREAAEQAGVDLIVQAAEREIDVEKQMQIIENLIQTGIKALCVTPSGSREILPAIAQANQRGIPVIIVDTRIDTSIAGPEHRIVTFIGSDNYQGGLLAGRYIVERLGGQARVAVLEGIPGHETGDSRLRGFHDGIAGTPGIQVLASQPANWERDQGYNVFQNLLQAHPAIDTLFACSDQMALGALEAIAAAGKNGQVRVIGFDALEEARQAVAEGRMLATVAQFPSEMGRQAVQAAVRAMAGESVPAEIPVRIELITAENSAQGNPQ